MPMTKTIPANFVKPPIYNDEKDIYHIGNSVQPPGEHAGAAVLSGKMAAQAVNKVLHTVKKIR